MANKIINRIILKFNDDTEFKLTAIDEGWKDYEEIEKSIRNAKRALEEAFTPHLKSMLSAKLLEDEKSDG